MLVVVDHLFHLKSSVNYKCVQIVLPRLLSLKSWKFVIKLKINIFEKLKKLKMSSYFDFKAFYSWLISR